MNNLFYLSPAKKSGEALPLGNGRLGAMLYAGVERDIYTLNDDTLWSGHPRDRLNPNAVGSISEIRDLILSNDFENASKLAEDTLYGWWGQCYMPAGTLEILSDIDSYSDYNRTLSLDTAVHTTEFNAGNTHFSRQAFISHKSDTLCIRYTGKNINLTANLDSKLRHSVTVNGDTLILSGEAPGNCVPSYLAKSDHARYSDLPAERGMTYTIALKIKTDGRLIKKDTALGVEGASTVDFALSIKTSFKDYKTHPFLNGAEHKKACLEKVNAPYDFETLKQKHISDYKSLFDRVCINLGDGDGNTPTDIRLKMFPNSKTDLSLISLLYQYGRYLLISSSRAGQPANLQGIWNDKVDAPWSCNYTTNINVQMNYWGALGAALPECCEPLCDMIKELSEAGKSTAKALYGANGFTVHHNTDLWRITTPMGAWNRGTSKYAFFPLAGAWLTRHLYEQYLYTGDREFLSRSFDAIKGSAEFCDSMLCEREDGKLIFCPAASPENVFKVNGKVYGLSKSSAMFQSIVRDAFEIFINTSEVLNRDTEYAEHIKSRLDKTAGIDISSDGTVTEWDSEYEEHDIHHRHLSQLYALYPAKQIKDKALLDACRRSLEKRGDEGTGWSSAWKICLWAVLGDGNRAESLLHRLMTPVETDDTNFKGGGTYPNLLNAHPPFQIDGSLGLIAGINEMLLQVRDGTLILLPALPDSWHSGSVKGMRIEGGSTVNLTWKDNKPTSLEIDGKAVEFTNGRYKL